MQTAIKTTALYTEKRLQAWKESLWAMWEEGFKLSPGNITLLAMKSMFMTGFDAGRGSFVVIPDKPIKSGQKSKKAKKVKRQKK
jgi:hypothetical protein